MRQRVEQQAAELGLRGAHAGVLNAVLTMLCTRWSRVVDDRLRLAQLVAVIVEHGGRRHDVKTVGRALSALAHARLITYQPARGRGGYAVVAIHDRFLADVQQLSRDDEGRVVVMPDDQSVTFSPPPPSYSQSKNPPTPRRRRRGWSVGDTRPVEVTVNPGDIAAVLDTLPAPYRQLPRPLLGRLRGEIRTKLAAGWRPEQITEILSAPLPADLTRPWRLALWRLRTNMPGAGPRLAPLQRAWEQRQADAERQADAATIGRWHRQVMAVTTAAQRAAILRASRLRLGRPAAGDEMRELAHAARMATRQRPAVPLAGALAAWVTDTPSPTPPPTLAATPAATAGQTVQPCVSCQAAAGIPRPQLPIPELSAVCEDCWEHLADPDLLEKIA